MFHSISTSRGKLPYFAVGRWIKLILGVVLVVEILREVLVTQILGFQKKLGPSFGGYFENLDMTSEGFGEIFEGDFANL